MAIKYTEEQLNSVDKSMLILANKNRFGRSSEKMEDTQQMRFIEVDGTLVFFNEAEAVCDLDAPEPETLEAAPERKKK